MQDRYLGTDDLISKLQQALPFHASVTKHAFAASAQPDKLPVRNKQRIRITEILDGGDGGGILCVAAIKGGEEMLAISITHLRFDMRHPLYKEVRSYQIDRMKRLAVERMLPTG